MNNNLKVYVWTSNQQMIALQAWSYLFNKFWPYETEVNILGYDIPKFSLPANFTFNSLGEQKGPKYWSDDMILEAMNLLLDELNPSAEEGQKYAVTFDIYNGSNTTETFLLIKTDGVWVLQ